MSSRIKIPECLEWCTKLPSIDHPRESSTFLLNGNEWILRLYLSSSCSAYMILCKNHSDMKPFRVKFEVGFEREDDTWSLGKGEFRVAKEKDTYNFWNKYLLSVESNQMLHFLTGTTIKFRLNFESIYTKILLEINKERQNSSRLLQMDANFCLEKLSQDLSKMLADGVDTDIELKCQDRSWKVHKNILSTRSNVLQAMLHSDMEEGRTGIITLQDMDVPTAEHFLSYLYCGKLPEMTTEKAKQLYKIGDKYAVECLKRSCAAYLMSNITPESACEIFILADQHSDASLKESIIDYMINKKLVLNDSFFQDFRKRHPTLAFEIYDRFCKIHCSK